MCIRDQEERRKGIENEVYIGPVNPSYVPSDIYQHHRNRESCSYFTMLDRK